MSASHALSKLARLLAATGIVTVAAGGTGITDPGASGNVLTSDGAGGWASAAPTGGGGSSTFAGLTDGPGSLAGHAGDQVVVNGAGTALEYFKRANVSDPAHKWFAASGATLASPANSYVGGDPQVLWDGTQWVMLMWFSQSPGPPVTCYYSTASTLAGPWSAKTEITSLQNYHKPVVLVDEVGAPVKVGGLYHAYAVAYTGALSSKEIYHFTASAITGPYTLGSKVIAKGAAGSKDEYNTDAPFALYKNGVTYLWYMGAPTNAVPDFATYGYAERILRATATNPDGPFTKNYTDVITPGSSGAWDYGWLGGTQIMRRPGGGYMMVYNAGNTRPGSAGTEPAGSKAGYAYADTIDGPWTKDAANPYFSFTGWPPSFPDNTNIWRTYLAYDPVMSNWYAFYNTGGGTEVVSYAISGYYEYFEAGTGSGSGYLIQQMTTSAVVVTNSRVNVMPGIYRVRYQYNVGTLDGTLPKLDVDIALRFNGTLVKPASRDFVGSYAYENRDIILEYILPVTVAGYFDVTVQVTNGTPTNPGSQIRRGRINVERLNP